MKLSTEHRKEAKIEDIITEVRKERVARARTHARYPSFNSNSKEEMEESEKKQ